MVSKVKHKYEHAEHWDDLLTKEFAKESDRAAVILTGSLFDNALAQLLKVSLVASPASNDDLLEGANAPLATFSSRINACYRIGLISKKLCRDLHLLRSIRNAFAHNVSGCTFEDTSVRNKILEIAKSSSFIERNPKLREGFPEGPRGDFLISASWMLWAINKHIEMALPLEEKHPEWGYDTTIGEAEVKKEREIKRPRGKVKDTQPSVSGDVHSHISSRKGRG